MDFMATRVGGEPGVFIPPPGLGDNRLDQRREQMLKELIDMQLVHSRNEGEHLLESVVRSLRPPGTAGAPTLGAPGGGLKVAPLHPDGVPPDNRPDTKRGPDRPPQAQGRPPQAEGRPPPDARATTDIPKLVADFQRNNGLPVTGKLDPSTVNALKDKGLITTQPPAAAPPSTTPKDAGAKPVEQAPPKTAPRPEDTAAARQARNAAEQQLRARVDGNAPKRDTPAPPKAQPKEQTSSSKDLGRVRDVGAQPKPEADRVVDPSRLLASLFTAGFVGKKGKLEDGLKSFQATFGLPITGKLDAQTQEALAQHGHVEPEASPRATTDKPVEPKQQVRRALQSESVTSKTVADKDVQKDPIRPQAATNKPTTSNDVAARAPSTSSSDAAEKARLDTVAATQQATERGVQEATGDPTATQGHGEVHGEGAGQKGAGGVQGGGNLQGAGPGGLTDARDESVGEESATANAKSGDDNFSDEARGNANVKGDGDGEGGGYWSVPPLSEQVRAAMEKIGRDDDGSGPVTYTWDVTFHRPGVYASGQPAEEIWRVAVQKATAFDPVWQQAADAIASRMLYAEPDATPPTIDDFILALRRARVR
jgi:hypothetical protein